MSGMSLSDGWCYEHIRRGGPREGDLSICLKCGTITQFDAELKMVKVQEGVLEALKMEDPGAYLKLRLAQEQINKMNKKN